MDKVRYHPFLLFLVITVECWPLFKEAKPI